MKIPHLVDPHRLNHDGHGKSHVHFQRPGKDETLCGVGVRKTVAGIDMQALYECDMPITCKKCRVQLEVGMRDRLYLLTTPQLEDLLALTNGYLWEAEK